MGKYICCTLSCMLFLAVVLPIHANAEEWAEKIGLSAQYDRCLEATQTNSGWAACGSEEIKRQEGFLNKAWEELSTAVKKYEASRSCDYCVANSLFASYEKEQEDWKKLQESACEYYKWGGFGREDAVLAYPACKAKAIADRTKQIQRLTVVIKEKLSH